jgi:uncharacterized protein YegL
VRKKVLDEVQSGKFGHVVLFVVSDGEPTDCTEDEIVALATQMKREGFFIISGFITSSDLPNPRVLVSTQNRRWSESASAMFQMASVLPTQTRLNLHEQFHKRGWALEPDCRLFAQINQSENLGEFMNTMLYQFISKGQ